MISSRRSLLGIAGAAGVLAAVAASRSVTAAPNVPSEADAEVLAAGMAAELAVSDLYQLAVSSGVSDETFATIAANQPRALGRKYGPGATAIPDMKASLDGLRRHTTKPRVLRSYLAV